MIQKPERYLLAMLACFSLPGVSWGASLHAGSLQIKAKAVLPPESWPRPESEFASRRAYLEYLLKGWKSGKIGVNFVDLKKISQFIGKKDIPILISMMDAVSDRNTLQIIELLRLRQDLPRENVLTKLRTIIDSDRGVQLRANALSYLETFGAKKTTVAAICSRIATNGLERSEFRQDALQELSRLGAVGTDAYHSALKTCISDVDVELRFFAMRMIASREGKGVRILPQEDKQRLIDQLLKTLNDDHATEKARMNSATCLGGLSPQVAVAPLLDIIEDPLDTFDLRYCCLLVLARTLHAQWPAVEKHHGQRARRVILAQLNAREWPIRRLALRLLSVVRVPADGTIRLLRKAAQQDPEFKVREAAQEEIEMIEGHETGTDP